MSDTDRAVIRIPGRDGYTIAPRWPRPGFVVRRGRVLVAECGGWREAVATVVVDRESRSLR